MSSGTDPALEAARDHRYHTLLSNARRQLVLQILRDVDAAAAPSVNGNNGPLKREPIQRVEDDALRSTALRQFPVEPKVPIPREELRNLISKATSTIRLMEDEDRQFMVYATRQLEDLLRLIDGDDDER